MINNGGMGGGQTWVDVLHDLLCVIYEKWGGDCEELGADPSAWVDTVAGAYSTHGAPTFQNQTEEDAFLNDLTELETHLASTANTLPPAKSSELTALIAYLRSDLIG